MIFSLIFWNVKMQNLRAKLENPNRLHPTVLSPSTASAELRFLGRKEVASTPFIFFHFHFHLETELEMTMQLKQSKEILKASLQSKSVLTDVFLLRPAPRGEHN